VEQRLMELAPVELPHLRQRWVAADPSDAAAELGAWDCRTLVGRPGRECSTVRAVTVTEARGH
jgi:hypothetical protein